MYATWELLRDVLRLREVLITFGSFVLQHVLFLKVNVPAEVELPVEMKWKKWWWVQSTEYVLLVDFTDLEKYPCLMNYLKVLFISLIHLKNFHGICVLPKVACVHFVPVLSLLTWILMFLRQFCKLCSLVAR